MMEYDNGESRVSVDDEARKENMGLMRTVFMEEMGGEEGEEDEERGCQYTQYILSFMRELELGSSQTIYCLIFVCIPV